MARGIRLGVVVLASLLASGCRTLGDYLAWRGMDLMDCVKLSGGVGLGIAVDMRATDWFAPGLGYLSYTTNWGWDDRDVNGLWEECVVINTPREVVEATIGGPDERTSPDYDPGVRIGRLALASVFLANERWIRNLETHEVTVDYYSLFNFSPVAPFLREADPGRFFLEEGETAIVRSKPFWDQGWFEVGATVVFVQARVGVNVFQAVDFLLGILTLDPAGDDRRVVPYGGEKEARAPGA